MKITLTITILFFLSCGSHDSSKMINTLQLLQTENYGLENPYSSTFRANFFDSLSKLGKGNTNIDTLVRFASAELERADEKKAVAILQNALKLISPEDLDTKKTVLKLMAISWMRLGERINCLTNHSTESCIFPIQGKGIHADKTGSSNAIKIYDSLLRMDSTDLESRWLINLAYMTIGGYPNDVPKTYFIEFDAKDSVTAIKPFKEMAMATGLNTDNLAGGSIIDDFNNDGFLDVITSSWSLKEGMHYFISNGKDGFTDVTDKSGLKEMVGGLNMMQADYNNDGFKDIFVTRGGWMAQLGKEPNSLLKNNGDGTFTDVTEESGLVTFRPSQTATWADFNNDGWLDLFVGNETSPLTEIFPCEFYINNKNGTFTEMSGKAGIVFFDYVKGVTSGDYNNDGLMDIFISSFNGKKTLYKNLGIKEGIPQFKDVSGQAGLTNNHAKTFSTWFWDYDNDGYLDILMCAYRYVNSLAYFSAAESLGYPNQGSGRIILYKNNGDGTFSDVSAKTKLNKVAFAMSSNFGDIDNDGWLDFYLGTGNPHFASLVPNKLFRNNNGNYFEDVTSSARVGNLQKGHEISIADIDNDGNQDIHIELGGSFESDHYPNSLYINPGQNDNNWFKLQLIGTKANKSAIGSKIRVFFKEKGKERMIYRELNTGSSFGANPLLQHIGIGTATIVDKVEIAWAGSGTVQQFTQLSPNTQYVVTEGNDNFMVQKLKKINLPYEDSLSRSGTHSHGLQTSPHH